MITDEKKKEYVRRLILARMHLLSTNGFFGLLLMHAEFALDSSIETAATDGDKIYFSPKFMEELSDRELEFVLMHEIMHIAFGHCFRGGERDPYLFNVACDIVINSNILQASGWDKKAITLKKWGESMHLTPKGKEGCEFTAEEVYETLIKSGKKSKRSKINAGASGSVSSKEDAPGGGNGRNNKSQNNDSEHGWDNHDKWKDGSSNDLTQEERDKIAEWNKRIKDCAEAVKIRQESTGRGTLPLLAERVLKELTEPKLNWREILSDFVQEEVVDYSFSPPDKRYQDSPFFLPDFNDPDFFVKNVLFMIDTSASMSDAQITEAYSEVKGALDQFDGKLQGLLGFFDFDVVKPKPFDSEETFKIIKPKGGGGTSFENIFKYVKQNMMDDLPVSIIILTDGYAPFPNESESLGIPVLWLLNNKEVNPPWGKVARL